MNSRNLSPTKFEVFKHRTLASVGVAVCISRSAHGGLGDGGEGPSGAGKR